VEVHKNILFIKMGTDVLRQLVKPKYLYWENKERMLCSFNTQIVFFVADFQKLSQTSCLKIRAMSLAIN